MFRVLSKSVIFMFLFDMFIFALSTAYWYDNLQLNDRFFMPVIVLTVLTGLFTLFLKSNYKVREFNNTKKNFFLLLEGTVFSQVPTVLLFLFVELNSIFVKFIAINIITIFVALKLYRIFFHYYLFKIKPVKNILILGTNKNAQIIANEINDKNALRMKVAGFVNDTDNQAENNLNFKVFSSTESLDEIIKNENISILITALREETSEIALTDTVKFTPRKVKLYTMYEFYEMITGKYYTDKKSVEELFTHYLKHRSIIYDICKRIFDIVAATIVLVVTLPITLYIAIRVKLTDGGNVIYTQNRVGKGGKIFKAYKLRTMYSNDYVPTAKNIDKEDENISDDRIIPFCRFVRKARFDEIPQMINILKGEMSIVAPRAEWDELVNIYLKDVPFYSVRMWDKTGWTGWAQINQGHCISSEDIAEKLQYDLYYLKYRNIFWEIMILIKAVFLAVGGRHE